MWCHVAAILVDEVQNKLGQKYKSHSNKKQCNLKPKNLPTTLQNYWLVE